MQKENNKKNTPDSVDKNSKVSPDKTKDLGMTMEIDKIVGEIVQDDIDFKSGKKKLDNREVSFEVGEIRSIISEDNSRGDVRPNSKDKQAIDAIINEVFSKDDEKNPVAKDIISDNSNSEAEDVPQSVAGDESDPAQRMFEDIFDRVKKERYIKKTEADRRKALVKDKSDEAKKRIRQVLANTDTLDFKTRVVKPEPNPQVIPEPKPEIRPEPRPEIKPEPRPEVKPEPNPQVIPEPRPEVRPDPKPEVKLEPRPEIKPEPKPEINPEPRPEINPEPTPEVKPEPNPQVIPEPRPEVRPEPKPEIRPEPKPQIMPEPKPEIKPAPKPEIKSEVSQDEDEFMFIEDYDAGFSSSPAPTEPDDFDLGLEIVNADHPEHPVRLKASDAAKKNIKKVHHQQESAKIGEARGIVEYTPIKAEKKLDSLDDTPNEAESADIKPSIPEEQVSVGLEKPSNEKGKKLDQGVEPPPSAGAQKASEPGVTTPKKSVVDTVAATAQERVKGMMTKAVSVLEGKQEQQLDDGFEDKWNEDWHEETQEILLGSTMQFEKIKSLIDKERKSSVLNSKKDTFENLDKSIKPRKPSIKDAVDIGVDPSKGMDVKESTKNDLLKSGQKIEVFESNFMEIDVDAPKKDNHSKGSEDKNEQDLGTSAEHGGKAPDNKTFSDTSDTENTEDEIEGNVDKKDSGLEEDYRTSAGYRDTKAGETTTRFNKVSATSDGKPPKKATREQFVKELKFNARFYNREIPQNQIRVISSSFTDILRTECIESAKLTGDRREAFENPSKPKYEEEASQKKNKKPANTQRKKSKLSNFLVSAIKESFLKEPSSSEDTPHVKGEIVDYERVNEAPAIRKELVLNQRRLIIRTVITSGLTVLSLILSIFYRFNIPVVSSVFKSNSLTYILISLGLLLIACVACKSTLKNGAVSFLRFKGNSDTAVTFLAFASVVQCIVAVFTANQFSPGGLVIYPLLAILGLFFNSWGKFGVVRRIFSNFKFVSGKASKYCAKIYTDEKRAIEMFKGVGTYRPVIAYQKETGFLTDFLKLSYEPDPSERFAGKVAFPSVIISVIIGVIYGAFSHDIASGVTAMALCASLSYPVAAILAVNKPIGSLCKKANSLGAMLIGYPGVMQFCDTNAVVISAKELYPKTCVGFHGIKGFGAHSVDKAVLEAASVIIQSESPLSPVFKDLVKDNFRILPVVEKMRYEDDMGIEAWVKGRRILVGNRILMENHGIAPPSREEEMEFTKGGRQVTYIAAANELLAMIITSYKPSDSMIYEMQRLEDNGISFLVTTEDPNITPKIISEHFRVFFRSVKILPNDICVAFSKKERRKEPQSRGYLATTGKLTAFARMISACVRVRSNVTAAIVTQGIAVVLGLLIALLLMFTAGVQHLNVIEMLIYCTFWVLATLAVPYIRRP